MFILESSELLGQIEKAGLQVEAGRAEDAGLKHLALLAGQAKCNSRKLSDLKTVSRDVHS